MKIKSRKDAQIALPTIKSKLRAFEKRIYDLGECTPQELIRFLIAEKAEFALSPEAGIILMGIETLITGKLNTNTIKYWGNPLGCDFQFRKVAKRKNRKNTPLPQRFHGRIYLFDQEIVVVTETETDPKDPLSGFVHLNENPVHQIIRLWRK